MRLIPVIASYSGGNARRMKAALTEDHLATVAALAGARRPPGRNASILHDLQEMHVVRIEGGMPVLDTAVFMEDDIRDVSRTASELARELAPEVASAGSDLLSVGPEARNLLAGIVGLGQALSASLRQKGVSVDWRAYGGPYASTKVDFDEDCEARDLLGPDLQQKSVLKGRRYRAVFIGPGGTSLRDLVPRAETDGPSPPDLCADLVDTYARLVGGLEGGGELWRGAELAGLRCADGPSSALITAEVFEACRPAVEAITAAAIEFHNAATPRIVELLRATTAGRQGAPAANMMMHFWRYYRRAVARELYRLGYFTDDVPASGLITVFYDGDTAELVRLLA